MILRGSPQREDRAGKADQTTLKGHLNVRLRRPDTALIPYTIGNEGLLKEEFFLHLERIAGMSTQLQKVSSGARVV